MKKLSIKILNDEKKWFLETKNTAYVIGVDENKNIQHLYWFIGEKNYHTLVIIPEYF